MFGVFLSLLFGFGCVVYGRGGSGAGFGCNSMFGVVLVSNFHPHIFLKGRRGRGGSQDSLSLSFSFFLSPHFFCDDNVCLSVRLCVRGSIVLLGVPTESAQTRGVWGR